SSALLSDFVSELVLASGLVWPLVRAAVKTMPPIRAKAHLARLTISILCTCEPPLIGYQPSEDEFCLGSKQLSGQRKNQVSDTLSIICKATRLRSLAAISSYSRT